MKRIAMPGTAAWRALAIFLFVSILFAQQVAADPQEPQERQETKAPDFTRYLTISLGAGVDWYPTLDEVRRAGSPFRAITGGSGTIADISFALSRDWSAGGMLHTTQDTDTKSVLVCGSVVYCISDDTHFRTVAKREVTTVANMATLHWQPAVHAFDVPQYNSTWGALAGIGSLKYAQVATSKAKPCQACEESGYVRGTAILIGGYRDIPIGFTARYVGFRFGLYYLKSLLPELHGLRADASNLLATIELRGMIDINKVWSAK